MLTESKLLDEISESPRGIPAQKLKYLFSQKKQGIEDKPVIRGDNIERYGLKGTINYFPADRKEFEKFSKQIGRLSKAKIMVQNIVAQTGNHLKIIATYDNGEACNLDTVNNILLKDKEFNPKYTLAILNSSLISYYAYNFIVNRAVRTMHFEAFRQIPIKQTDKATQQKIASLVDEALKNSANKTEFQKIDNKIERETYKLYGITTKEQKMIEKTFE